MVAESTSEPLREVALDPRVARTRSRVLGAAWEVLAEVGFDRVTIELISERSGVARSTMYRHWTTREEILRDAFSARAAADPSPEEPPGGTSATDPAAADARGALAAYAVTFAAGLAHDWGRAALSMATRALDEPDQRVAVRTFADGTYADLRALIERARSAGHLPTDVEPDAGAALLVDTVIAPLFYRYQVLGEPADADQARALADQGWRLLGVT